MRIADRQIAADHALPQHVRTVVRRIARWRRLGSRQDVASIHLQARGSAEAVVEFAAPFAFSPEDDAVRAHEVCRSIEQNQATDFARFQAENLPRVNSRRLVL